MPAPMAQGAFADRVVDLLGAPEQLSDVASLLASRTRLAVLETLVKAREPLHINEIARRVGVDASPVRTHLELLLRGGIVREVASRTGRERNFETTLADAKVVLVGVNRESAPEKRAGPPPKEVAKLTKRLKSIEREMTSLASKAAAIDRQIAAAWAKTEGA